MKSCAHAPLPDLSRPVIAENEARHARGEKQGCCPHCGKWIWPDAFNTRTDYLEAMDWADSIAAVIAYEERPRRKRRR